MAKYESAEPALSATRAVRRCLTARWPRCEPRGRRRRERARGPRADRDAIELFELTAELRRLIPQIERRLDQRVDWVRKAIEGTHKPLNTFERLIDDVEDTRHRERLAAQLKEVDFAITQVDSTLASIPDYSLYDPIRILYVDAKLRARSGVAAP